MAEKVADADPMERPTKQVWGFGLSTLVGVFSGMLFFGIKEFRASASVSKDAEVMLKMGSTADKREQYRLMRDAMEKRFLRVARGSLVGGVRLGMFTGIACGIQNLLADVRGVPAYDVFNFVAAGSITYSIINQAAPGSLARRAAFVAGVAFPVGWMQMKWIESLNQEMVNSKSKSDVNETGERAQSQSQVGAAIDRLENSLEKK